MTEKQILQQINRVSNRRLGLYGELERCSPFLTSEREDLVKDVQDLDHTLSRLYQQLRTVRASGVKVGRQKRREHSEVMDRLRQTSILATTRPLGRLTATRARHERLMRLKKEAAA